MTTSLSSAVPIPIRRPSRAGRLAARDSYLSYRLKPRSTSRSITSALDRLVLHPRRDRSTSIMTSAQPGGSYEDRRETHGCSRHLAPPAGSHTGHPLICARVENERVSRQTERRRERRATGRGAKRPEIRRRRRRRREEEARAEIKKAREEKHPPRRRFEASDRGPRPHVSCQARTRVSVRAPRG